MCLDGGLSIIGLALSAAGSVAGFAAKQQQYDRDVKAYNQNVQNSLAANRNDQQQIAVRGMQEQQAFVQKDRTMVLNQAEKEADVQTTAAGANVAGLSVSNLVADIGRKTAENRANAEINYQNTAQQLQQQNDAATDKAQSRINSMPVPIAPNPLSMIVDIGGAGIKAFGGKGG